MASPKAESMLKLAELYACIAEDLDRTGLILRDELISDQDFISDLCAHIGQFHGKMLRPAVLLLAGRACGEVQPEHHVLAAVAEIVHIATLVHDDVLDEADIRRRAATVNRLWGNERAVLLGDFLISHAFHLCSSLDSQYAARLIGRTTNTVCEGEMMQVANRGNWALTEEDYLDIISRKTAALIAACCELGARYAGADADTIARLCEFGRSLGIAFQITDDLLDLTGDEAEAGKSLGRDVDKGKVTLPVIHYLRTAKSTDRARLRALLESDDPQRHRRVGKLLVGTESLDYAHQAAQAEIRAAIAALGELPPSDARASLTAMAEFVSTRRQ